MTNGTVMIKRHDPYKNFKFLIKFDGTTVAGVSKVSGLKRTTEVVKHREGADLSTSYKSPGRTEYEAITLERGVTSSHEFENWANKVWDRRDTVGGEASLEEFRKDITIELLDDSGSVVVRYFVHECWVSEYNALPDLDANANAVAIQSIKIENEGWERDEGLTGSEQPSVPEGY